MDDKEKIRSAIAMLRKLKRMVGFFMKRDIADLIERLESKEVEGLEDGAKRFEIREL